MKDLSQFIGLAAVAAFTGWVVFDALRKGVFHWKSTPWTRRRHPLLYYAFVSISAGICLLAIRVLVFGLFGF